MNKTKIEYLDFTWNPIVGCTGEGCYVRDVCWARGQAKRRKHSCSLCYQFLPHYHFERFDQPLKVKKPARIGVGFMGDLFDKNYSIIFNQKLFRIMEKAKQHTFLILTKQPENMLTFFSNWQNVPANVWVGVTVNKELDCYRIDQLRQIEAPILFVSFEPLQECILPNLKEIDWIIIGAQKRPNKQPKPNWVGHLVISARIFGAKVFLKNNLYPLPTTERYQEIPPSFQFATTEKEEKK